VISDVINGTGGPDVIDGAGGNDVVHGLGGNDTFIFNSGYGSLEIDEQDSNLEDNNVLKLGTGINPANISVTSDGDGDFILTDGVSGDQIKLDGELYSGEDGVQNIQFSNGTDWSRQTLLDMGIVGTSGNDTLSGTSADEWFEGKGGVDTITGGGGNDVYLFKPGDGQVTIVNNGGSTAHGVLEFDESVNEEDVWFKQSGNDLVIQQIGSNDNVTVQGWFGSDPSAQLSEITLNGTAEIDSQLNSLISAMATYSSNNPSFNPATATVMPNDNTLQTAIAAGWH
jgi:Ca2+-binding RTX toxin-like protein